MTNPVPQFPGKPAQTGTKPSPPWKDMICPELTAGELARQGPTTIVQLGANNAPKAVGSVPCLGPKCAKYVQIMDGAGGVHMQGCGIAVSASIQLSLTGMVSKFIEAAEAGARAEAAEREREAEEERLKNMTPEQIRAAADELVKAAGGTPPAVPEPSPLTAAADKTETPTT